MISEEGAYLCLADKIQLELIVQGSPENFYGDDGVKIDFKALGDQLRRGGYGSFQNPKPTWIKVDLGQDWQPFAGLLDGGVL